ncbi:MAG: RNA-guided endonuclease TnpB family protein [Lachnospiraceae bacterium]|nr:RNA-guided endonuclease TnpB family protein [Lachnospiraceae bacterium]
MNRAYKYRIYPNKEQEQLLFSTFGSCRFVYNQILALQAANYKAGIKHLSRFDANKYVNNTLKKEYPFLKEVDKFALTNAVYALENGYQKFFKKQGGYPRFKKKHRAKRSYTTNFTNGNIVVEETYIKLPKLKKIKASVHRRAPEKWKLKSATISQERDGSYYCSILYEFEHNPALSEEPLFPTIGLDYKSDGLYADSEGTICGSPKYYRKQSAKLAKAQRKLKGKTTGSNNYDKQQKKAAKIHRKIANQRKDYLHKESTRIANWYGIVCVEDLNMRAMSNKGFGNGKATLDNGYGMFLTMLEYKLAYRGKRLVKVDPWFPSSQICSCCGALHKLSLADRIYRCGCGAVMDRDYNAAVNIRDEGLRLFRECA